MTALIVQNNLYVEDLEKLFGKEEIPENVLFQFIDASSGVTLVAFEILIADKHSYAKFLETNDPKFSLENKSFFHSSILDENLQETLKMMNEFAEVKGFNVTIKTADHQSVDCYPLIVMKKNTADRADLASKIEQKFNINLPQRLKSFFGKEEYKNYNNHYITKIPTYDSHAKFLLDFDIEDELNLIEKGLLRVNDEKKNFYMPLCKMYTVSGDERFYEVQFLAVDISKGKTCPVSMFDHEDGHFKQLSRSFDDFLLKLSKK